MAIKIRPISLEWTVSEPKAHKYINYIRPVWPHDATNIKQSWLKEAVEKSIRSDIKKDFVKIEIISKNKAKIIFDTKKWMDHNFKKDAKVKFILPRTLEWKWKTNLPNYMLSHVSWNKIKKFLKEELKYYLKNNAKLLFRKKFKIMKRVNYDWFIYDVDMEKSKFIIKMKFKIMLALSASGYYIGRKISGSK